MSVDQEFERVRTALRAEEHALAREFERIDAEARAAVDASVQHVRTELATQADRIREAIAREHVEAAARQEELIASVAEAAPVTDDEHATDEHTADGQADEDTDDERHVVAVDGEVVDGKAVAEDADDLDAAAQTPVEQPDGTEVERVSPGQDAPGETIGDVERGD